MEKGGKFQHQEKLANVQITAVELYRYQGCDECHTKVSKEITVLYYSIVIIFFFLVCNTPLFEFTD